MLSHEYEVGDRIITTWAKPKPRWWQLWKLFSYYILRRKTESGSYTIVAKTVGGVITLNSSLADAPSDVVISANGPDDQSDAGPGDRQ